MLIETTHGQLDDSTLELRTGTDDAPEETTDWIEYWLGTELVHRSVHVIKKTGNWLGGTAANIG